MISKKKILFILGVFDSGGVAKSLVSLVNAVDRERFAVSLLVVSNSFGPYVGLLPNNITIIKNNLMSSVGNLHGLWYLLRHGHLLLAMGSILRFIIACFSKAWSAYILSRLMPTIDGEYDLIVDYNGQQQTYYMVDKLKAKRKVAFFHSDYSQWPYYYKMDRRYYPKLDAIFTVSPACVDSLKRFFPNQSYKIRLMENITSLPMIERMAAVKIELPEKSQWKFLTVGHICKNKGTDLAIKASAILKSKGINFTWYFVGNDAEKPFFEPLILDGGVSENIVFCGIKSNPYPYFKACDIIVHPSLFEGKSVTLDEAKLLCKPVVVTNFSTVNDQFENGVNANIVEMSPGSIANGIEDLINDKEKRKNYVLWLCGHKKDNSSEVNKLYKYLT